jgi:protein TonB
MTCGAAAGQTSGSLEPVIKLYASAEYDQALVALGTAEDAQARMYRALCLLALDRQPEAQAVLQALVTAAPEFVAEATEVPPRFLTLFTETRRRVIPVILRGIFTEARQNYQAKAIERARPEFERVVAISSSADVRDLEVVADLRTLAEGFIDLAGAPSAKPVAEATPPRAEAPTAPVPRTTTPPIPIQQEIPAWPANVARLTAPLTGAVRVQIDRNGAVTDATMIKSIHPRYDGRVLAAASRWSYRPATVGGTPVESETQVDIRVIP